MSSSITRWNPFQDLGEFQKRLATMFGDERHALSSLADADWHPAVDVAEDDKAFLITADLPEVKKEDAKVVVKDGVLTISGELAYKKRKLSLVSISHTRPTADSAHNKTSNIVLLVKISP